MCLLLQKNSSFQTVRCRWRPQHVSWFFMLLFFILSRPLKRSLKSVGFIWCAKILNSVYPSTHKIIGFVYLSHDCTALHCTQSFFSPFHHLDMTLILLKGTHNPDPSSISIYSLVKRDDQIIFPGICGQKMARLASEAVRNARYDAVKEANTQPADTEAAYL